MWTNATGAPDKIKVWTDWTGQNVWQQDPATDTWYNPGTSQVYSGKQFTYLGYPEPEGNHKQPWQWQKDTHKHYEVDYEGRLRSIFQPGLAAVGVPDWQGWIQRVTCQLLQAADNQISTSTAVFRGISDAAAPTSGGLPAHTEMAALTIGIDNYENQNSLKYCVDGATKAALAFNNPERYSVSINATEANGYTLAADDDILKVVEGSFCKILKECGSQLKATLFYAACHAVQVDGDVYLIPAKAELPKERFERWVKKRCVCLQEVAHCAHI